MDQDDKMIEGKRRKRCDCCGCLKYDVSRIIEPYAQDMAGVEEWVNYCVSCETASSQDI